MSVTFPSQSIAYGYQTSYSYDTLNNLTTVSQGSQTRTFSYSSLARLLTANNPESGAISYVYDGEGNRVKKVVYEANTTTVKEETIFVYSSGKLVEEYSTKTPPSHTGFFANLA